VACENDVVQLMCNPYSRIAIYSASYGRTEYESLQCAQPQGVKEESKYRYIFKVICCFVEKIYIKHEKSIKIA
jgi:hypothetical protein